jgi:hypothetical protein
MPIHDETLMKLMSGASHLGSSQVLGMQLDALCATIFNPGTTVGGQGAPTNLGGLLKIVYNKRPATGREICTPRVGRW